MLIAHEFIPVGVLAQSDSDAAVRLAIWAVVLIAVVIAFGVVLMLLRRKLNEEEEAPGEGLMLDDLRKLRDTGQISHEEFQRAVDAMAGRVTGPPQEGEEKNTRL
ncbi:MAG: hypothetical protein Phyf2KO_08050 [Phycisphaerales bacterium]